MQSESEMVLKQILLTAVFTGFALFLALFLYGVFSSIQARTVPNGLPGGSANSVAYFGQAPVRSELPMRLKIPAINIDAALEYVSLTPDGAMAVPKNPKNAAWFEVGPRPGEKGTAVISGHYGWKGGKAVVFDDLYKLRIGDKLYIEDARGATTTFVVRGNKEFAPNADTREVFGSNDEGVYLNLITCGGIWNEDEKDYPIRLVVFADKE